MRLLALLLLAVWPFFVSAQNKPVFAARPTESGYEIMQPPGPNLNTNSNGLPQPRPVMPEKPISRQGFKPGQHYTMHTDGTVTMSSQGRVPTPSGRTVPIDIVQKLPKATVAKSLGKFFARTIPIVGTAAAFADLLSDLGFNNASPAPDSTPENPKFNYDKQTETTQCGQFFTSQQSPWYSGLCTTGLSPAAFCNQEVSKDPQGRLCCEVINPRQWGPNIANCYAGNVRFGYKSVLVQTEKKPITQDQIDNAASSPAAGQNPAAREKIENAFNSPDMIAPDVTDGEAWENPQIYHPPEFNATTDPTTGESVREIPGSRVSSSQTTTNSDGTKTTTTTTTTSYASILNNTVNFYDKTVITQNGNVISESIKTQPTPDYTNPQPAQKEPEPFCNLFPNSLACATMGEPPTDTPAELPDVSKNITFEMRGASRAGTCPAPVSFTVSGKSFSLSYQPICDFAGLIRPLFIGLAYLAGAFIFIGAARKV